MKIRIIGAVAAGTAAAAKARRNSEEADIAVYERDTHISYSGCGMPFAISGTVADPAALTPRDPAFFRSKYRVEIHTRHEVTAIDAENRVLTVKNLETGETFTDSYDQLIVATGAVPVVPEIPGVSLPHVFTLRNIRDMERISAHIASQHPSTAVVAGTGFIGLEMADSLRHLGMEVVLLEKAPRVHPALDADMSVLLSRHLVKSGFDVRTGVSVDAIDSTHITLSDGSRLPAGLVILATGVRPASALARSAGCHTGLSGAVVVSDRMETSVPGIYACGDCTELPHLVSGQAVWRPLGSVASKTGRVAGDAVTGGTLRFPGILGTGIFSVAGMTVARTGLGEDEARAAGFDPVVCHNIKPDKPEYLGGREMTLKAVADKQSGRLLGAQILGTSGVDKRVDILATAITYGASAASLADLDLAYAPPFSTTRDPVHSTGMILDNTLHHGRPVVSPEQLKTWQAEGQTLQIVDARAASQYDTAHVDGAVNMPQNKLRQAAAALDREVTTVTYCNKGVTGNAAQNILLGQGFRKVYNLSGGNTLWQALKK